jgi:hypothetical protein
MQQCILSGVVLFALEKLRGRLKRKENKFSFFANR